MLLNNERAEVESRTAEVSRLVERMFAAEEDSESLHVARALVAELTAELASLAAGNKHTMPECNTLTARIRELKVAAVIRDGDLGAVVRAGRSFKGRIVTGDDRANTAEAQACQTLDKISELWALVGGLNRIVVVKRAQVAGLVEAKLGRNWSVITSALSESEGPVS